MSGPLYMARGPLRVYRATDEDLPDRVKEKALAMIAEWVEPDEITDSLIDHVNYSHEGKGISVEYERKGRTGPYWSTYPASCALTLKVDTEKALRHMLAKEDLAPFEDGRISFFDVTLRAAPAGRRDDRTEAESFCEWSDEIEGLPEGLADRIMEGWSDLVREISHEGARFVQEEYESLTSWETLLERLKDLDEGLDENGRIVPLSDCIAAPVDVADDD